MEVPELMPMDEYNPKKAQLQTYVQWLLSKAYGNGIPQEAEQPFYYNNQGLLCLKPGIANGLTSADLYCRACSNIFKECNIQWQGHSSIMQTLSRKGIYVIEGKETQVAETSLLQTSPFKISSHLALIKSLMTAYIHEIVSVERVVQAVKKFGSVNASNELPYDAEDALLFWINKVCATLRQRLERELQEKPFDQIQRNVCAGVTKLFCSLMSRQGSKVSSDNEAKYNPAPPGHEDESSEVGVPDIPVMDDLLKDLNDGCCLAALISFYCPDASPLTEVALGNQLAIADSLHNLQLIQQFVERYLPVRCLHLNINDLFYTPDQLKVAVTVFLAEVFYWLEVNPVPSVRDVSKVPFYLTADQDTENRSRPDTAKQIRSSSAGRSVPISNATKRSFQVSDQGSPGDLNSQLPPPRQPLLPKRMQQRNSLHEADYRFDPEATRQSVRAWEDDGVANGRPHGDGPHGDGPHGDGPHGDGPRQSESPARRARPSSAHPQLQSSGLTNVTSANSSGGLLSNVSIDPEMSLDTDVSVDFTDIDSSARGNTYRSSPHSRRNPDDLQLESVRSAATTARGQVEPLMPAKLKPSKEKSANPMTKEYESGENRNSKPHKPMSLNFAAKREDSSSSDTTPEEDYKTPSVENVPLPGEHLGAATQSSEGDPNSKPKHFDAFFVDTKKPTTAQGSSPVKRSSKPVGKGDRSSFILHDQPTSREDAHARGIPIIDSNMVDNQSMIMEMNERLNSKGEPQEGDKRSNGEAFYLNLDDESNPQRPDSLMFQSTSSNTSSGEKPSPKTSFAQIKKQKDCGEVSPILYQSPKKGALKGDSSSGSTKGQKKTTFAALPNQTTWQESAQKSNHSEHPREGDAGEQPMTTELINLRMQLEERRRQMETEKQRMAMQWNKQRQRVSKQAFIQVVTKKDDGSVEGEPKLDSAAELQKQKETERKRKEEEERKKLEEKRREEAKREEERRKEEQRVEEERQRELERQEREEEMRREREKLEREEQEREEEFRRQMEQERWEEKKQDEERKRRQKEERKRQKEQLKEEERIERERVEERLRELERQRDLEAEKLRELERQRNMEAREGSPRDNGRSKWNNPAGNGRPMSFHAGHEATPPPYQGVMSASDHERYYPPAPESTSSADSTSTSGEYGTSLDRLNSSLNELQGEIMRLSLQQDHIKSLVNEPRTLSPSPGEQPSQTKRDKFYSSQGVSNPDQDLSSNAGGDGPMRTSGGYSGSYPDPMRTSGGYNSGAPITGPPMYPAAQGMPYGGPNQMYGPQFMPPGYPHPYLPPGQPASTYPVGMQQYPQPMYQQPGMYQGAYQGQWPPGVAPPPHLPPGAPYAPTSQPPAQTHMATAPSSYMHSPGSDHHDYMPQSPESPTNHSSPEIHSPEDANSPDAVSSLSQKTDVIESHGEDEGPLASSTPPQQPTPPNKGFFVSFEAESPSPRKQKPKLPSSKKKESSSSPVRKEVVPPPITTKPDAPDISDLIEPERTCNVMSAPPVSPGRPAPPAIGFVIDAEEIAPTQDEIDFEKKRQKVLEMQMKRREEAERKKAKLEAERQKKAEKERGSPGSHRAKQEQSEQKRADDKARRDQIFQQYLARKAEREASEEESKAGLRDNVPRRQRQQGKSKVTRPHSQPPSAAVAAATDDKHSVSSQSHSSQEDISAKGHIMSSSASKITPPEEGVDGSYLSFGGMTHRRPPSPGWARSPYAWRSMSNSLGRNFSGKRSAAVGEGDNNSLTSNNSAGSATNDYSGRRSLPLSSRLLSGSVSSLATTKVVAPPIKSYGGSTTSLVSKAYGGSMTSLSAKHSASTTNLSSRTGVNGPKLFVKPSSKSNRNIIINALSHCCLAGIVNSDVKNKTLEVVGKNDAKHFLILFRDHGQQYRSIYSFNPDTEEIYKITGNGPKSITNGMVERFYKYNSGAKSFAQVTSTKHISVSIDAITLYNHFWQKKVAPPARKANLY